MIEALGLGVLREISSNIRDAHIYAIMADESADISNKEHVVVCIRWVDEKLIPHEDFIGINTVDRTTAEEIAEVLKNTLKEMHLKINDYRGQCYDGASTRGRAVNLELATRIKSLNGKTLYTHCYGHVLNLSVKDVCSQVKCLKTTFDTGSGICKLVKLSPQRETHFKKVREESKNENAGVHHDELMELWKWSLSVTKDTAMRGRIIGAKTTMKTFEFLFGCAIGKTLLTQTDHLSGKRQDSKLSSLEAQSFANLTATTMMNG